MNLHHHLRHRGRGRAEGITGMDGRPGRGRHGRGFGRGGDDMGLGGPDDRGFGRGLGRGGEGRFGAGRGGMRRGRLFARDELHLMVLSLLGEGAQHGYQLMRAFEERSGGAYVPSPGVLYPLLAMLEEMGEVETTPADEGKRRQVTLTDAGRAALETGRSKAEAALARLAALTPAGSGEDLAPVRRAMTGLKTALSDRLSRPAADAELALAIAAILDEATHKIERL